MSRLAHRLTSFLDRFEEQLELDCDRLKCQLLARVDHQFRVVRAKVTELRSRFGGDRADRDLVLSLHLDDPKVETVSLDEWILERRAAELRNEPSTSSGHKRKSTANRSQSSNKRQKTQSTAAGTNKNVCKHPGCGKTFPRDANLAIHERIHLDIKPFSCSWPKCGYSAEERSRILRHVRTRHFKLPETLKQQHLLKIEDNRDANEYVLVDNDLVGRRLD